MTPFIRNQAYTGPIQAVILDWAGTAVDFGCFGPVAVFQAAFEHFGISPTIEETRAPMGIAKRDHVAQMLATPRIVRQWHSVWGREPADEDVEAIYIKTLELMPHTLARYAEPVPGCGQALARLRSAGIRIGSCTGYTRSMMRELIPKAASGGFEPDCLVCSDDVPHGRPWPWMCWQNCMQMGVFPPEAVVKVGDTVADIQEGINAGCWSVGIIESSSGVGLTPAERGALEPAVLASLDAAQKKKLLAAGAHFVIAGIEDLPLLCERINSLLAQGRTPQGAATDE